MHAHEHECVRTGHDRLERQIRVITAPLPNGEYVDPHYNSVVVVECST